MGLLATVWDLSSGQKGSVSMETGVQAEGQDSPASLTLCTAALCKAPLECQQSALRSEEKDVVRG